MLRQPQGERRRRVSRRDDGQCHRKQTARFDSPQGGSLRARVKRWGKSPPRQRRRWRHEKPRPVQGKIGGWVARPIATGMPHPASPCEAWRKPSEARLCRASLPQGGVERNDDRTPACRGEQNPAYRPQNQDFITARLSPLNRFVTGMPRCCHR
jgi:hypothetical protein